METSSIITMVIALGILWGGLVVAILHLHKNPDTSDPE